jgi:hypothetical protein
MLSSAIPLCNAVRYYGFRQDLSYPHKSLHVTCGTIGLWIDRRTIGVNIDSIRTISETFLINLGRGTGLDGLVGIWI